MLPCLSALTAVVLSAGPVRVEMTQPVPYRSEHYDGAHGDYELVRGRAIYEIDPKEPLNRPITDLELAPRNARGLVEFSSDLEILRPVDLTKGNRRFLYIVVNRGRPSAEWNDLLMRQGFSVVWSGWQGNIAPSLDPQTGERRNFSSDFPRAVGKDGPITGKVYTTFYVAAKAPEPVAPSLPISFDRGFAYKPIPAVSTDNSDAELWTREHPMAERVPVPRARWAFAKANTTGGRGEPSATDVWLEGGFQPGLGYELVYTGKDPIVNGLSFAAVRDLVSFLKHEPSAANPLAVKGGMQAAHAYGKSQSGRFLRVFVHLGFNEDAQHHKVFDGLFIDASGGSQGAFNVRFGSPGAVGSPDIDLFQLTDFPPAGFSTQTDPYTKVRGSLLDAARARKVTPKIFQIQTSAEYWTRSGSLTHLTPDLKADQRFPSEVRYYHLSSTQHLPATTSTTSEVRELPSNPNDYQPVIDALFIALDRWVALGKEPPASKVPRLRDGTIGDWHREASGFPEIPGVIYPSAIHTPPIFDLSTLVGGVVTVVPMRTLGFYGALAPKVDADGHEIAGIRTPDIACPTGTHTGWTLYRGRYGAGTLIKNAGSFIPFARTRAAREASHDPRLSLEERYRGQDAYIGCVQRSAESLAKAGYLLPDAVTHYVDAARQRAIVP